MAETQNDIRRVLKNFGMEVDRLITEYMDRLPRNQSIRVRLILQDITEYKDTPPDQLHFEIEGEIHH